MVHSKSNRDFVCVLPKLSLLERSNVEEGDEVTQLGGSEAAVVRWWAGVVCRGGGGEVASALGVAWAG